MRKAVLFIIAAALTLSLLTSCSASSGTGAGGQKVDLKKITLASADLPAFPDVPDHAKVMEQLNALDRNALGDLYNARYNSIVSNYESKLSKYQKQLQDFRYEAEIDPQAFSALKSYTERTSSQIFRENPGQNIIYSPANFYHALCMLSETVGSESREELLALLGAGSLEEARSLSSAVFRRTYRLDGAGGTLLANSVWLDENISYHKEITDILAKEHYTSSFAVPMGTEETDLAVQQWINENTGNLLESAAGGVRLPVQTAIALISTLYFKDKWASQFSPSLTKTDTFTMQDGTKKQVPFMHKEQDEAAVIRSDEGHFTVAALRFENDSSMVFLLPDEGISPEKILDDGVAVEALLSFTDPALQQLARVRWSIPTFDIDSDLSLIETLKTLGVTSIFDENTADFSPLVDPVESGPMAVSILKHAARVTVDEEGCEAAAFTLIAATKAAAPVTPDLPLYDMDLNRPFIFMITGVDNLPLFIGMVNRP